MFTPSDEVHKRYIIDQKFEDGLWYLWESTPTSFGMDYERSCKPGDINTIIAELARRMREC